MKVTYSSNNSGGSWWLTNDDWLALEKAGWNVVWGGKDFCHSEYSFASGPRTAPNTCPQETRNGRPWNTCKGHQQYPSLDAALAARYSYLGCNATEAWGEFASVGSAISSWEKATGLDAADTGCDCCGPPHNFSGDGQYVSGDEIVGVLYPSAAGRSLRDLAAEVAK